LTKVLTVDIGTTSAKVLLVSPDGEVSYANQVFYPTQFPLPGWAEQDATVILHAVNKLVAECAAIHGRSIEAISLSSAMHSIMAVDADGQPLSSLIIWSDLRSAAIARDLREVPLGTSLHEETGTPVHPMSPLCKLVWLRRNDPAVFQRASRFVSIKEYIVWNWCSEWIVDYSVASATGLFDIRKLCWSQAAVDLTGVGHDRLSTCVSPYHRSAVKNSVASTFGLQSGITVVMGASDGCLAHLAGDAGNTSDVSLTIGTSGAVRKMTTEAAVDPDGRLFNYRLDEKWFITGGATNNGTVVVDWFKKNFCSAADTSMEHFVSSASVVRPGSGGLIFLPFVFGERSPYYNPDLRGMLFGLAQHHTINHMSRSVLEGICFEMRMLVEAVAQIIPPVGQVIASGGFIRSPFWVQMLADILNREVIVRDVNDASSMGAAMMAFRALDVNYQFNSGGVEKRYMPSPEVREIYQSIYSIFIRLGEHVSDEFVEIAALQTKEGIQ
jgi:gluconokinase